jgi:dTDP-4-dehydrorhamnose 3,5-epimerase
VKINPLSIEGAYHVIPTLHGDPRGLFGEFYRHDLLTEAVGHPLRLAQGNLSVSAKGVVRGVHFADVPPGQAKYVHCPRGAVLDLAIDLRVGSPTFGRYDAVRLDEVDRRSVYLAEGLGHAFVALEDGSTLTYLCSTGYAPTREHGIAPLDPALELPWPDDLELLLSPKDMAAPTLAVAREQGLLPSYQACLAYHAELDR